MLRIDKEEVDLYCIYCPETDKCYYLDPKNYQRSVTLRVEKPKNNQTANVRLASDYQGGSVETIRVAPEMVMR